MPIPDIGHVDHIHIYVANRPAAEEWYGRVLGLQRNPSLEEWASVPQGPLMLQNPAGTIGLAIFERQPVKSNHATIAFGVSGQEFCHWITHLSAVLDEQPRRVDHGKAWSVYFSDPDGNPFEITTYDYAEVTRHCTR